MLKFEKIYIETHDPSKGNPVIGDLSITEDTAFFNKLWHRHSKIKELINMTTAIRQDIYDIFGEDAPCPIDITSSPTINIDLGTLRIAASSGYSYFKKVSDQQSRLLTNIFISAAHSIDGVESFNKFVVEKKPKVIFFVIKKGRILHGENNSRIRFHYA